MQNVGQKTMYDMRKEIFARLQALPMSFYDQQPVGRLVTRVTTDVDALNDLFASGVVAMINDAFLLVSFVVILFYMNWRLAIATLSVLPLMLFATWMFRNKARDGNRRIRTALARINAFLNENISGMAVVQLFNRERKAQTEFAKLNRSLHGSVQGRDFRVRAFLSRRGILQHAGHRSGFLVWRIAGAYSAR